MNSSCYKVSDNKFFNCPARMADGRHFTDYRPNCHLNNGIRFSNNMKNTFDYRRFLTNNADELMKINASVAYERNGCASCKEPYHQNTMLPEKDILTCNKDGCQLKLNDKNGLGIGRCYGEVKGFSRNKQPNNCCGNANSVFSYFGGKDPNMQYDRHSLPSGGNVLPANLEHRK